MLPGGLSVLVFALALAVLVPTTGDFGLTWDEPAYRYSQVMSAQWWEQLTLARSQDDLRALLDPMTLLYYWPYARYGINFHPPLAGQLNLAAHAIFGKWMKDIPSRRMASVIEFALTVTFAFTFLARRYGLTVGLVTAGSLLFMPRLYGQAHLIDTDIPGLLLWAAASLAFWKGLYEENARAWRVLVGVLLGLAFLEKMAAVGVLLPLLLWLLLGHLPRTLVRHGGWADWTDGLVTTGLLLLPLGLAFQEIQSLQRQLPPPAKANLFVHRPSSDWSGAILAVPLLIWLVRRLLGRLFPRSKLWGMERPALEIWTSILAFAPLVGWLGNPAWWRETLPRLAHYYTLSNDREHVLPRIQIIYFGQTYEYCLPWHNAWVLLSITVPATILAAAAVGILWSLGKIRRDRLPVYFLLQLLTHPVLRMLPTPAHDGVRLFLPTFFFLAAFAGWGTDALSRALIWLMGVNGQTRKYGRSWLPAVSALVVAAAVLVPAAIDLIRIHPFELSYYNALIGGPRGAWRRGFELTYWFDAINPRTLKEINERLPAGAEVDMPNESTNSMIFEQLQSLGALRGDIRLGGEFKRAGRQYDRLGYVCLQTQDSKATSLTRLLFAMRPWYACQPSQLDGLRVFTIASPTSVSRAWALAILLEAPDRDRPEPPKVPRLLVNQSIMEWVRTDPQGLLAAARKLAKHESPTGDPAAQRLLNLITSDSAPAVAELRRFFLNRLLACRAEALVEAVEILINRRDAVIHVMTRYPYTDPDEIGGFLDRDLPEEPIAAASPSAPAWLVPR
jgi:4-amino-4-deoxy-L-arabinose transferase-like glycosyltransferase